MQESVQLKLKWMLGAFFDHDPCGQYNELIIYAPLSKLKDPDVISNVRLVLQFQREHSFPVILEAWIFTDDAFLRITKVFRYVDFTAFKDRLFLFPSVWIGRIRCCMLLIILFFPWLKE